MSNTNNSQNQPAGGVGGGVAPVTPVTPSLLPIAGTVQAIQTAMAGVPGLTALKSAAERRVVPKMQTGGEGLLPGLVEAIKAHPEALPPTVDLASIQSELQRAAELVPLKVELAGDLRKVEDSILVLRGDAWKAMLAIYAQLQVLARHAPDLLGLVAQMEAFLAKRAPKKATGTGKKKGTSAKAASPPSPAPAAGTPAAPTAGSDGLTVTAAIAPKP